MNRQPVVALLGRRDWPTDAVEEYCQHLGEALADLGFGLELRRVPWDQHGWSASLEALRLQAASWQGRWILVQYTALAWSARGVPQRFLAVMRILRKAGARIAVVFHDAEPFGGMRFVDWLRRMLQGRIMRAAVAFSDCSVLTVPATSLSWLGGAPNNSVFIPVGANLPQSLANQDHGNLHDPPTVAVFSITGGGPGETETRQIIEVMRFAAGKVGRLRLLVFGRHAEIRETSLREGLQGLPVELQVEGVIDGQEVVKRLEASDVLLFLRGAISSRRSSAIAGIACGMPVVGLCGAETAAPITMAGTVLVDGELSGEAQKEAIAQALVRVLTEDNLRRRLAEKSRAAQEQFFSWPAIAEAFTRILRS